MMKKWTSLLEEIDGSDKQLMLVPRKYTYGSQFAINVFNQESAELRRVSGLENGSAQGWKSMRRDPQHTWRIVTYLRHLVATRDFARFSRAATGATAASLSTGSAGANVAVISDRSRSE